jgi:hypothetical protein
MKPLKALILIFCFLTTIETLAQVEYEPLSNTKVYSFLEKMYGLNLIKYNLSSLPLSKNEIQILLDSLNYKSDKLNKIDREILYELQIDFETISIEENTINFSESLSQPLNLFDNEKKKYFYYWKDENANFYLSTNAFISYRALNSDKKNNIGIGAVGLKFKGSLYNEIGYYINLTTAQQISGNNESRKVFSEYDPFLSSARKFVSDKYVDRFEGYLRYQSKNYFAVTIGRENLSFGNGFYNKLFISDYPAPFDYLRIDLHYKSIYYSYLYGNIVGDSLGKPLDSKHIITNRIDFKFNQFINIGFWQALIRPNRDISFNFLNPISFLRTASYSSEINNEDNALMGIDLLSSPFNKSLFHFGLLIDDLNFSTLFKDKKDNKFAYQSGVRFYDPFGLNNLTFSVEYIKIAPFVYTHRSNKSTYSHWGVNLGPNLEPNSDQITLGINYWFSKRINVDVKYQYKRHAEGIIYDGNKIIFNAGGNLLNADGDLVSNNIFLDGIRKEYHVIDLKFRIEPIKQFYIDINYYKNWLTLPKKNNYKFDYLNITLKEEI